jgi:flavin-dependent dehydrogenase
MLEASSFQFSRPGEHLSPRGRRILDGLAVPNVLDDCGALESPGVRSIWGADEPHERDYLFNPNGRGWNLDRTRFDRQLAEQAQAAGAILSLGTKLRSISRKDGEWLVLVTTGKRERELRAKLVIDASGRAAAVARKLGARRRRVDRLCAVVAWIKRGDDPDLTLLVEACENGWWYSLPIPGNRLVGAFMCDADFLKGTSWRAGRGWRALLDGAPCTKERLAGARLAGPIVRPADTSALDRIAGHGWLAAGDAAMSVDPLSSDGIARALESGMAAGSAASRWLQGDGDALQKYAAGQSLKLHPYLFERAKVYREERRWPGSPFWQRRQLDPASIFLSPDDILMPAGGVEHPGASVGLDEGTMRELCAFCVGGRPAQAIVRDFRVRLSHIPDDHVIFALQDLVIRGVLQRHTRSANRK